MLEFFKKKNVVEKKLSQSKKTDGSLVSLKIVRKKDNCPI